MFRRAKRLSIGLLYFAAIGIVVLCVRSFFVDECVRWRHQDRSRHFTSGDPIVIDITDTVAWGHGSMYVGREMMVMFGDDPLAEDRLGLEYSKLADAPVRLWNDLTPRPFGQYVDVYEYGQPLDFGRPIDLDNHSGAHGVGFPLWALAAIVTPPLLCDARRRVCRWRQSRRRAAGLCAACGYDVRASTTRCPECGMPVLKTAG